MFGRKAETGSGMTRSAMGFILSIATVASLATNAIFTDQASLGANAFSTADVEISTSPSSGLVTFTSPEMTPGDKVTGAVTVSNAGTVQMRYSIKSTTTENTLAAQLDLTVKSGVTTCSNAGFGTDGTVEYGPGDLGSTTDVNLVGDPTQGSQSGDRDLNASASETLCFQVSLPFSTGNAYENLDSTATFTFDAEQTANN